MLIEGSIILVGVATATDYRADSVCVPGPDYNHLVWFR